MVLIKPTTFRVNTRVTYTNYENCHKKDTLSFSVTVGIQ